MPRKKYHTIEERVNAAQKRAGRQAEWRKAQRVAGRWINDRLAHPKEQIDRASMWMAFLRIREEYVAASREVEVAMDKAKFVVVIPR